jgi:hypothetical protein
METIKTIKDAKAAGTAIGAACEAALGDTLTARVLAALRTMPKGKAVSLIGAFWEGFDSSAPTIRGLRRIKVTRSESVRIARGIDAGLQPVDSWAESVKAAPKAETGKGSGGGRKPRPAGLPAGSKGAPAPSLSAQQAGKPAEPAPLPPCVGARQLVAQLVAFCHNHKSKLPADFLMAVDDLAELSAAQLKD